MTIPSDRSLRRLTVTPAEVVEAELKRLWILSLPPGHPPPPTDEER
jgi:hypothetical protein